MSDTRRANLHIVAPGVASVADLCRVERAARALPGVRRVTLLELRAGAARLSLRVDAGSDRDAIGRALAIPPPAGRGDAAGHKSHR